MTDGELDELVDQYLVKFLGGEDVELGPFIAERTLADAIRRAVSAKDGEGRHFDHQSRIRKSAYPQAVRNLLAVEAGLASAKDFDELLRIVEHAFSDVKWAGELFAYDTAYRIGAKLNLEPDAVYLHSGTRDGAIALGMNGKLRKIPVNQFPVPLRRLTAPQLESFLCVRKDRLG